MNTNALNSTPVNAPKVKTKHANKFASIMHAASKRMNEGATMGKNLIASADNTKTKVAASLKTAISSGMEKVAEHKAADSTPTTVTSTQTQSPQQSSTPVSTNTSASTTQETKAPTESVVTDVKTEVKAQVKEGVVNVANHVKAELKTDVSNEESTIKTDVKTDLKKGGTALLGKLETMAKNEMASLEGGSEGAVSTKETPSQSGKSMAESMETQVDSSISTDSKEVEGSVVDQVKDQAKAMIDKDISSLKDILKNELGEKAEVVKEKALDFIDKNILPREKWPESFLEKQDVADISSFIQTDLHTVVSNIEASGKAALEAKVEDHSGGVDHSATASHSSTTASGTNSSQHTGDSHSTVSHLATVMTDVSTAVGDAFAFLGIYGGQSKMKEGIKELKGIVKDIKSSNVKLKDMKGADIKSNLLKIGGAIRTMALGALQVTTGVTVIAASVPVLLGAAGVAAGGAGAVGAAAAVVAVPLMSVIGFVSSADSFISSHHEGQKGFEMEAVGQLINNPPSKNESPVKTMARNIKNRLLTGKSPSELQETVTNIKNECAKNGYDVKSFVKDQSEIRFSKSKAHAIRSGTKMGVALAMPALTGALAATGPAAPFIALGVGVSGMMGGFSVATKIDKQADALQTKFTEKYPKMETDLKPLAVNVNIKSDVALVQKDMVNIHL